MNQLKGWIFIFLQLLITLIASAQSEMKAGIIYDENIAYLLAAPEGWVLDNNSLNNNGLPVVFYPKGESWRDAETVMYSRSLEKNPDYSKVAELIAFDSSDFLNDFPDADMHRWKTFLTDDSATLITLYFGSELYGSYEMVAYTLHDNSFILICITSRTKEGLEKNLPTFETLVNSYALVSDNVLINNKE